MRLNKNPRFVPIHAISVFPGEPGNETIQIQCACMYRMWPHLQTGVAWTGSWYERTISNAPGVLVVYVSAQPASVAHCGVVSRTAGTQVHNRTVREHLVVDVGRKPCLQRSTWGE